MSKYDSWAGVGSLVKISQENDNEGYIPYRNKVLRITHEARNREEHAGFDEGIGQPLFDLKVEKTGKEVPFSLYEYELEPA